MGNTEAPSFRALLDNYNLAIVLYCEEEPDDESTLQRMNAAGEKLTDFFATKTDDVMHNTQFARLLSKYSEEVIANISMREDHPVYLDSSDEQMQRSEQDLLQYVAKF